MAKRSLKASTAGIKKARHQFMLKGWTQEFLATEVGIKTRQPIWRFFAGQPIERFTFFEICSILDLDWREICDAPPAEIVDREEEGKQPLEIDIDTLVKEVRSLRQDKITNQCGILQLLDISHPVSIESIYIDINILEKIASQQYLEISELNNVEPKDVDRFGLGKIAISNISGIDAVRKYRKLRVLGKPGAGKSTFLKYLAMQSNLGRFARDQVPVFITLRDFAESVGNPSQYSLSEFIHQEFINANIPEMSTLKRLLQEGRVLLLIDGMDEVIHEQEHLVLNEIRRFTEKYHKNRVIASCRTANQKLSLKGFTDVELAPFTSVQVTAFSRKWFIEFSPSNRNQELQEAADFIKELELPQNWRFQRLTTTPLFLHLACSIFHRHDKFPVKQAEFYKQGMDLLLGKWDEARGIERDQIYKGFLLPRKMKLLSQIASATFEKGQYIFKRDVIEQHISDYMQTLPTASDDAEEIQQVSAAVLRSIESQHGLLSERARGIFSFSYLALQEYFTARKIVASHNLQALGQSLEGLVSHISDPHWREIFLLTSTMLRSADGLVQLMKQQIDEIVTKDPHLQEYLAWASQKSDDNSPELKPATSRAFYLALTKVPHVASDFVLASTLDQGAILDAGLEDLLQQCINSNGDLACIHACGEALANILESVLDLGFHNSLQKLSDELPDESHTKANFEIWCQQNYAGWSQKLQDVINYNRQISNEWKFSPKQEEILQRYYDANKLLLDCLNGNSEITHSIRTEIEESLLLPQKELEKREWN